MGSALVIRVMNDMPEAQMRRAVEEQRSQDAYEDGHRYSGTWGSTRGLHVSDRIFPSVEEAEAHVQETSDKFGPLLAVKARKIPKDTAPSARMAALETKCRETDATIFAFPRAVIERVRAGKSKTKGCARCGSAIAVAHIRSAFCPVCAQIFLYSTTDEKRLKALTEKKGALQAQLKEARVQEIANLERRGICTQVWVVGGWCPS